MQQITNFEMSIVRQFWKHLRNKKSERMNKTSLLLLFSFSKEGEKPIL